MSGSRAFYYVDGIPTKGMWIDLEYDVTDEDDIKEMLAEAGLIPMDEDGDPDYDGDLLVAVAEGLARHFLSKYDSFDLQGYMECQDYIDRHRHVSTEAVEAYIDVVGSWSERDFEDIYYGKADSEEAFAEQYCDDCMEVPEHLKSYIDYEKLARDLFVEDFYFSDGFVFRRN